MARIAFLGLGVMGHPMAGHLARAGHAVTVWNRSPEKAQDWCTRYRGERAETPGETVWGKEFVAMCLGDDPDVEAVFADIESQLGGGVVVIDHTTASADLARRLSHRAKARGAAFLDAPVSGGEAGAQKGQLTVMVGGADTAFAQAEPLMLAYAKQAVHIGDSGAGQLAKCVNQICIAGVVQGLSEGLAFAQAVGLDPARVIEAISKGAAQSWQMDNRWKTMVEGEFEHGFALDWMRKDLRIALSEARDNGAQLPVAALVDQFYADLQAIGGGRWDTSALIKRLTSKRASDAGK